MTIYLHCGAHKTASTFMQSTVDKNRDVFNSQLVNVRTDEFRNKDVSAQEIISICEQDYANNYHKILFSEDACVIGLMLGFFKNPERGFFHKNAVLKFSETIAKVKEKYSVKFLLCVRRQDTYIESCYKFRKKRGAKYSFDEFFSKTQEINISWFDVIDTIAKAIGEENCHIIPYELLRQSQDKFMSVYFNSIGDIPLEELSIPQPTNQSPSDLSIIVMNYLDNECGNIPVRHRREIVSIIEKHQKSNKKQNNALLTDELREQILQKYAESNQKMFAKYIRYMPANFYDYCRLSN